VVKVYARKPLTWVTVPVSELIEAWHQVRPYHSHEIVQVPWHFQQFHSREQNCPLHLRDQLDKLFTLFVIVLLGSENLGFVYNAHLETVLEDLAAHSRSLLKAEDQNKSSKFKRVVLVFYKLNFVKVYARQPFENLEPPSKLEKRWANDNKRPLLSVSKCER
jgi:hypothetical protein